MGESMKPVFTGTVWVAKRTLDGKVMFEHEEKAKVMEWMLEQFFKDNGALWK